jgi:hypothetical protein
VPLLLRCAGASLLSTCLPPPEAQLLSLKALDASSPELLAVESTVSALLRLLPPVLSAGAAFPHELPLEEYLFHVSQAGRQPDREAGVGGAPSMRMSADDAVVCIHSHLLLAFVQAIGTWDGVQSILLSSAVMLCHAAAGPT